VFGDRKIATITRESIQRFLADKAVKYSHSTLRSMRAVLGLTLGWAVSNGWLERNPCIKIKLPKQTGGRRVVRADLSAQQIGQIVGELQEPYATLVLLIAVTGLRIGEAAALKWSDLQNGVLSISRRIFEREIDTPKSSRSVRKLPLDQRVIARLEALHSQFPNSEWMFPSETGKTPIDPRNALNRQIRPACEACEITIGGWHDFRHFLSTNLRRMGTHPKVVSDILGHSRVNLAMDVYDRASVKDMTVPLGMISTALVSSGIKSGVTAASA
jgi:integrase